MKFETFIEVLNNLKQFNEIKSEYIDPEYTDSLYSVIESLLKEVMNPAQIEWFDWWIWETDFGRRTDLMKNSTQTIGDEKFVIDSVNNLWRAIDYLKS